MATSGYHPWVFLPMQPSTNVPAADLYLQELHALQDLLCEQLQQAKGAYKPSQIKMTGGPLPTTWGLHLALNMLPQQA